MILNSPTRKNKINFNSNNRNKNKTIFQLDKNINNTNISNKKKTKNIKKNNTFGINRKNTIKCNSAIKKKKIKERAKKIMSYNNKEINELSYELALKHDKRIYCLYYISLLKTKHSFISTFFNNNDYNSKIIKIDLLFFDFFLSLTINTIFFSDNTMHKIYEDEGAFNFIYQLPQIIYSTLASIGFSMILNKLALSQDSILDFKKIKNKKKLDEKMKSLISKIKIKFIFYFILITVFILFFWYYISLFCTVYRNTQFHLIKDTPISYALSFIYPLGIKLIPGICRIPALSNVNNKRSCLYKFSKFLQIF